MVATSPAAGRITKSFGRQPNGTFHYGTDRGWGNGFDVVAMLPGRVAQVHSLSDYGLVVLIDHGRDVDGRVVESRYCHLSSASVVKDEQVGEGAAIAVMGSSGSLTKQVHLHSELWLDGVRVDETKYTFRAESSEMTTYELVSATTGNPTGDIYFSVNRVQRYKVPNEATLTDYASWLKDVLGLPVAPSPLSGVFPFSYVRGVANIHAFGAVIPASGSGSGYNPTDADVVDEGELGQALTSTVALVNEHADDNKDAILAAINGLTITVTP